MYLANLSLVVDTQLFCFVLALLLCCFNIAPCIFGNIVAAGLADAFQQFNMPGRHCIALLDKQLAGWLKDHVVLCLLAHHLTQAIQCRALCVPRGFEVALTLGFQFCPVKGAAAACILYFAVAPVSEAIDSFDSLPIQVLFQLNKLFIKPHQLTMAHLFIDMGDYIQRKVEDTLQIARRQVEQQANATRRTFKVPDVADG